MSEISYRQVLAAILILAGLSRLATCVNQVTDSAASMCQMPKITSSLLERQLKGVRGKMQVADENEQNIMTVPPSTRTLER